MGWDASHSFHKHRPSHQSTSYWIACCPLKACAFFQFHKGQPQSTPPYCEARECTLYRRWRDAPNNRSVWCVDRASNTSKARYHHEPISPPTASTCQSWRWLREGLRSLSHTRYWSSRAACQPSPHLSASCGIRDTWFYCCAGSNSDSKCRRCGHSPQWSWVYGRPHCTWVRRSGSSRDHEIHSRKRWLVTCFWCRPYYWFLKFTRLLEVYNY